MLVARLVAIIEHDEVVTTPSRYHRDAHCLLHSGCMSTTDTQLLVYRPWYVPTYCLIACCVDEVVVEQRRIHALVVPDAYACALGARRRRWTIWYVIHCLAYDNKLSPRCRLDRLHHSDAYHGVELCLMLGVVGVRDAVLARGLLPSHNCSVLWLATQKPSGHLHADSPCC